MKKQHPTLTTAKFKKEIAYDLGISLKTLQRRLKLHKIDVPRGLISPKEQNLIYEALGWLEVSSIDRG